MKYFWAKMSLCLLGNGAWKEEGMGKGRATLAQNIRSYYV
jgi:hypothetical protein